MQRLPIVIVRAAATAALLLVISAPTAGAEIVFERSGDLWAMNDDGSGQHMLVDQNSVPTVDKLGYSGVDPGGTTLAFDTETAVAYCEINCQAIYTLSGGVLRRLSGASRPCTGTSNACSTLDTRPTVAPDGEVLFENFLVNGGNTASKLMRQSMFGGAQTEIPAPCSTGTFGGDVQRVAVNPANPAQIAFANCYASTGAPTRAVHVAGRDGSNPTEVFVDDAQFQDLAFTSAGYLLTNEDGAEPGIWKDDISGATPVLQHVLGEPPGVAFGTPREISGNRIAFVAENDIWTVPSSCTSTTCTYPGNATRLTTTGGHSKGLTWTSQTIASPSTGGVGGTGGIGGGGGGGGGSDPKTTSPTISRFALSSRTFRAARGGASIAARSTGTKISHTDNQAGTTTTFAVQKPAKGARKGRSCVKRTRTLRRARSCTRYVAVGKFKRTGTFGANSFRFTGRIGGKTLKPGRYRLVATPRNTAGKVGKALTLSFRIIR